MTDTPEVVTNPVTLSDRVRAVAEKGSPIVQTAYKKATELWDLARQGTNNPNFLSVASMIPTAVLTRNMSSIHEAGLQAGSPPIDYGAQLQHVLNSNPAAGGAALAGLVGGTFIDALFSKGKMHIVRTPVAGALGALVGVAVVSGGFKQ